MGFDYSIEMCLRISPDTGEAVIGYLTEIPYEPAKHRIPAEFRKYLVGRGSFFHQYMPNKGNCVEFVERWYDQFPSWDDIDKDEAEKNEWTEEDHAALKELLYWFIKNNIGGVVSWSY